MQQEHTLDYKWEQYIELYLEKFPNMIQIENIQFFKFFLVRESCNKVFYKVKVEINLFI